MNRSRIVACWRLWGFCPGCNSDGPEIDTCRVCENYRSPRPHPPNEWTKNVWWTRWCQEAERISKEGP